MTLSELTPPLPHSTHCHQLCYRSAEACLRSFGRWHCNPNSYIFTFLKYDIWLLRKNHLDINLANSLFLSCLCCRRMKAILRWTKVPRLNNQLRTCGCIAQIWWQFFLGRFAQTMQTCKGLGMFWWGKANRFLLAGRWWRFTAQNAAAERNVDDGAAFGVFGFQLWLHRESWRVRLSHI